MPWAVYTISLILSILIEVLAGNHGWSLPCVAICAFYFTMRYRAEKALVGALFAAALTDAIWMHHFPGQVLVVLLVVGFSSIWRGYGDLGGWLSLGLSGFAIGVFSWLGLLLSMAAFAGHALTWRSVLRPLVPMLLKGVVLLPIISLILNMLLKNRLPWLVDSPEEEG
ncbi:MAG: hypothetical protein J6Y80_01485 [Victivallales bacterium]|nr:hypothetical protein [Victivallales bacterium]